MGHGATRTVLVKTGTIQHHYSRIICFPYFILFPPLFCFLFYFVIFIFLSCLCFLSFHFSSHFLFLCLILQYSKFLFSFLALYFLFSFFFCFLYFSFLLYFLFLPLSSCFPISSRRECTQQWLSVIKRDSNNACVCVCVNLVVIYSKWATLVELRWWFSIVNFGIKLT